MLENLSKIVFLPKGECSSLASLTVWLHCTPMLSQFDSPGFIHPVRPSVFTLKGKFILSYFSTVEPQRKTIETRQVVFSWKSVPESQRGHTQREYCLLHAYKETTFGFYWHSEDNCSTSLYSQNSANLVCEFYFTPKMCNSMCLAIHTIYTHKLLRT